MITKRCRSGAIEFNADGPLHAGHRRDDLPNPQFGPGDREFVKQHGRHCFAQCLQQDIRLFAADFQDPRSHRSIINRIGNVTCRGGQGEGAGRIFEFQINRDGLKRLALGSGDAAMPLEFKAFNPQVVGHAALSLMSRSSVKKDRPCLTTIPSDSYNRLASSHHREGCNFSMKMGDLTHFNKSGRARMVDVSQKTSTERVAVAQARVCMLPETLAQIQKGKIAKGDVLAVAQVAGVMGAKRTPDLIPMCHPLLLSSVDLAFKEESQPDRDGRCAITVTATVKTTGPTGVEMEAMTAVAVAALTIYDMCKAVDRGISFGDIHLLSKSGGKSGTYTRP